MIELTKEFIAEYLTGKESEEYKCRVEESRKVKRHFTDKPDPDFLKKYQPSEPDWAITYKTENWRGITKTYADKIESTIGKIFRASDFVIKFEDASLGIADGESLQDYTTDNYPKVRSLQYYIQKIWLRQYLTDPNGLTVILPINPLKITTDYWRPVLTQVSSENVLVVTEEFVLIRESKDKWKLIDKTDVVIITKNKDNYTQDVIQVHGLGYIPARFNGGKICLSEDGDLYYESVVSGVCPWWDQALVEEADKNVAIKQHVHPEKAVYGDDKCKECSGTGRITRTVGIEKRVEQSSCGTCHGSGINTPMTSAFGIHHVRPVRGSELPMPEWGPAKYIQKDISPLEFLDNDIDKRILKGLEAVCMAQLAEETADKTESGIKKSYDWEQTNLYLYNIAVDICQYFLPWCYRVIADYRYGAVGQRKSNEAIKKMLPQINTPQRYDIVGVNDIKTQIAELKKESVSPDIINELEKQLVGKEFAGDTDTVNYLTAVIELDPLRNYTMEDKSLAQASGFTNIEDVVVSVNIQTLVQKAAENKGFYDLVLSKKRDIVYKLAKTIKQPVGTIPMEGQSSTLDTPIDVEAEAKAKLKGTVGGVQGVLAIQDSVSKGITDYEAAVTLLFEIYGFDTVTAKKILGTPKKIPIVNASSFQASGIAQ